MPPLAITKKIIISKIILLPFSHLSMKRKKFLFISAVAVAAAATPVIYFNRRERERDKPLEQPWILAQFCGEDEIRKIGSQYRTRVQA